jgi:heptaprenyl diphosphate synthase
MRNNTRRLAEIALVISFALILSFIESRIPAFVAIPGVKVGLANIAVIFMLYKFGIKEAITVSLIRVIIVSVLFGSFVSLLYSIAGAVLSFAVMLLLKYLTPLKEVTVSVAGGIMHNVGQIIVASIMLETNVVVYYLPFLILSGTVAGIVVGITAALLIKKINIDQKAR